MCTYGIWDSNMLSSFGGVRVYVVFILKLMISFGFKLEFRS